MTRTSIPDGEILSCQLSNSKHTSDSNDDDNQEQRVRDKCIDCQDGKDDTVVGGVSTEVV